MRSRALLRMICAAAFMTVFHGTVDAARLVSGECTYHGIFLAGKVKVVDSPLEADFSVRVVDSFYDLRVQKVRAFAQSCGQWQFVKSFPDFKIRIVESGEDLRIKFVGAFPGTD